jgi:hypothetical protein
MNRIKIQLEREISNSNSPSLLNDLKVSSLNFHLKTLLQVIHSHFWESSKSFWIYCFWFDFLNDFEKDFLLTFCETMKRFGYETISLFEFGRQSTLCHQTLLINFIIFLKYKNFHFNWLTQFFVWWLWIDLIDARDQWQISWTHCHSDLRLFEKCTLYSTLISWIKITENWKKQRERWIVDW